MLRRNILNNHLIFQIKSQNSFKFLNETHKTIQSFLYLQANYFSTLRLKGLVPSTQKGGAAEPAHSQNFSKLDLKISQKFVSLRSTHNHSVKSVSLVWPRKPEKIRDQAGWRSAALSRTIAYKYNFKPQSITNSYKGSASKFITDWKESWSKRKNFFKNLSHYKLENSDLTLLKNANEIRNLINSKYFFDIFLSKAINVKYNFNKNTGGAQQNSDKIDLNSLYKTLKYSFSSLSALISKPVYIYTSDKIYIQLFYFITPNWNKLKKQRKEKYLIKKTSKLKEDKNHKNIFNKIMTKFKIKNFLAHWKESNDFIRLPYLSEKFYHLALQKLDLPTEGKLQISLATGKALPLKPEENNGEGLRHRSTLKVKLEDKSKNVADISAETIYYINDTYSDSYSGSPANIFSPIVSTSKLDSYISTDSDHILYNLKNGQLTKVDILKFRANQVLQLICSDSSGAPHFKNSVYGQNATASKILESKRNPLENLSGWRSAALEQETMSKVNDGGARNLKILNFQSTLTSPLYNTDIFSEKVKYLCETGSATEKESGYVAPVKLLNVALKETVPVSGPVPVSVPVSEPVKELSLSLKEEELAAGSAAVPEQNSDLLSILLGSASKYKIGSFAMLENLAEQEIFLSSATEPATNQIYSLQLLKFKQTNTLISLNEKIFHKLISNLEKFFGKEVELIVKRIKYPYHDSNILSQLLKNNSNKTIFRKMIKKLFFTAIVKNPTKLLKTPKFSIFPSFLSGIKVKLAGRINTQRVIPRFTVQTFQMGSLARGKVNYIETSRITHKGKRGAFTFTVTTGHIFNNHCLAERQQR